MRITLNILGLVLVFFGSVWVLQGINILPGSFMSGQTTWLGIGIVVALAGLALVVWNHWRS